MNFLIKLINIINIFSLKNNKMEYLNLSNNKKGKMDNSKLKMIKSNYIIKKII